MALPGPRGPRRRMHGHPGDGARVVALGGGHGLAVTLRALRTVTDHLTAVVGVADDEALVLGLDPSDAPRSLRSLVEEHVARTGSVRGKEILASWADIATKIKKVIPTEYKRVLAEQQKPEKKWQTPAAS